MNTVNPKRTKYVIKQMRDNGSSVWADYLEETNKDITALKLEMEGLKFLSEGRDDIFTLFEDVRENFDNSEHMQGKKDGLRLALSFLGYPDMQDFNRGGSRSRTSK